MPHNNQKKIAVINDFCGFGRCSLAVSLPIISALKVQCCPLPTSVFSNHTGFPSFYSTDFTKHMSPYIDEWVNLGLHFSGILTGYLGSAEQIEIVKNFISHFSGEGTVTVIDPVMGDHGRLYSSYPVELSLKMRDLACHADILTPNLTEACILTDTPYKEDMTEDELTNIAMALSDMGPKSIVISGLLRDGYLENFIYDKESGISIVREKMIGEFRSGTGDVFSSIIAADTALGKPLYEAVEHASRFIARVIKRTIEMNIPRTDGIAFEEFLCEIGE